MASVEQVQCPNCGAPLSVEEGRSSLYCSFCGSALKIEKGASGHALAVLDGIKVDTGILAHDAARRRLDERLTVLMGAIADEKQRHSNSLEGGKPKRLFGGVSVLLGVGMFVSSFSNVTSIGGFLMLGGFSLTISLMGIYILVSQYRGLQPVLRRHKEVIKQYETELAAILQEFDRVTKQMDDLTGKL